MVEARERFERVPDTSCRRVRPNRNLSDFGLTSAEALATPHRVRRDNVGFRGREPSILSHTNLPILMLNAPGHALESANVRCCTSIHDAADQFLHTQLIVIAAS